MKDESVMSVLELYFLFQEASLLPAYAAIEGFG